MAGPSPKRLDFAKRVFAAAIDRIPPGFDAGLVSFRSCTRIDGIGPVKPADFGELRKHVEALAVQRGGDTAITESLSHARRLLSGTGGRVVLVTDGQETCRRDPCAVHGDIADDGIVVDVVDLTGVAALECLAGSSGGQVYRARGRLDVAELTGFVSAAMERACRGE
jgi:Ca-activated chloride channel family protein